jgi:hypothetical protein
MTLILTFMLLANLGLVELPTHSFVTIGQFITLLARKPNVVWKGCTRLPSSDKNVSLYSNHCTTFSVQTTFKKCNTFSWSFSFVSNGFRVRDEEKISSDSLLCVGYHVFAAYVNVIGVCCGVVTSLKTF